VSELLNAMLFDGPMHGKEIRLSRAEATIGFGIQPPLMPLNAKVWQANQKTLDLKIETALYQLTHITSRGWLIYEWRETR